MSYASEWFIIHVDDMQHLDALCGFLNSRLGDLFENSTEIEASDFQEEDGKWAAYLSGEPLFDDFYPPDTIDGCLEALAKKMPAINCTVIFEHTSYEDGDDVYRFVYTIQNGELTIEETEPDF